MLFSIFIALLHVASFLFSLHDRGMKEFSSKIVADSFGHTIHYYELKQPGAEWNILFIHGTKNDLEVICAVLRFD